VSDALRAVELLHALSEGHANRASPDRWDVLIRQARDASLLGTLAHRLMESGTFDSIPEQPRAHLVAARILCAAQRTSVEREIRHLRRALEAIDVKVVLLKGAAYQTANLPAAQGRHFSDIDILVPKDALPQVEAALMLAGFVTTHPHPYDQRYYRRWMHELPPMQHVKRGTVLDVHHTIVPRTSRIRLDASALLREAVSLPQVPGFHVLAPADMVLHSATHLFCNEDLSHGLRDLVDIDALLRNFGRDPGFWPFLLGRAAELDLRRPLHYALRWTMTALATPVPATVVARNACGAPGAIAGAVMDLLLEHALHPDSARVSTRRARRALYLRGHWLKMPLPMLAWHLTVKAMRRSPEPV
jgi:hypothetical protein